MTGETVKRLFYEAISSEERLSPSDAPHDEVCEMLYAAQSYWLRGEFTASWHIFHAFYLGSTVSKERAERVIANIASLKDAFSP